MDQSDGLQVWKFLLVTHAWLLNDRLKLACALLILSTWPFKIGHLTVVSSAEDFLHIVFVVFTYLHLAASRNICRFSWDGSEANDPEEPERF